VRIDGGRGLWGAILIALLSAATGLHAQGCEPWVARIISVQGPVMVERFGAPRAQAAGLDDTVCPGDRVRVGALGRAAVQLANEAETPIRLDEGTTLIFPTPEPEKSFLLKLIEGVVHVLSRMPQALTIETPIVRAYTEGTEFVLGVSKSEAELWVFEGRVRYANPQGELQVASGEGALARPGQAPVRRVLVKPREAVEWALYYPPLVDPRPESYPPALRAALSAYRANDLPAAFAALERVPAKDRDGRYLLLRAGLLMSVGRVSKAEADLTQAERADPKSGGASALRSVIALVHDQKDQALRLAESGASLDPNSPLPQAALSYAHQGRFEIEKALEYAKRAVELAPEDALLWARVSELELSRGDLDAALEAAQKAEALSPALARTQTVLGFAYLARIEVDKAKTAFERAIQGDPADPLPRLGMGLAKIRDGDLDEGTREIETAASLDPNNSLVRSYLGKAYYEQKRDGLASSEYEQAKLLDPKDPTPWFYDAIHKQTTNRPVEALQGLQRAIELNDNRAVYRSKLLLDQDLAARSASLGRIYRDLGFEQLALVEGWKSVNTNPADYSAHRLLADSYSILPRHEIARVSELLQSQLLQPLNVNPVQPQLAESNLSILEGAGLAASAFNEFNPLFTRNRLTLQASGVISSNDTFGDEVVHSGLWDNFSYSVGQFHHETDGFRPNNDVRADLVNGFFQASLSTKLSVQAEVRYKETDIGDINLFADDSFRFDPETRREISTQTVRAGGHYAFDGSDLIASFIHQDGENIRNRGSKFSTFGDIGEAQYLFRSALFSAVAGVGYTNSGFARIDTPNEVTGTKHANGYLYYYLKWPHDVTWTIGLSVDSFQNDNIGRLEPVNHKFGLEWRATRMTTVRLAAFRALKRSLLENLTVEPTQVAGFNQFFDDPTGTESRRYGIAVDHKFDTDLYGGVEFSSRELDITALGPDFPTSDWTERSYRAYVDWAPHPKLSANLTYALEEFEGAEVTSSQRIGEEDSITHSAGAGLRFFDPSGFLARVTTTYVNQKTTAPVFFDPASRQNQFVLVNAGLGYRLPRRFGIMGIEGRNLFDEHFNFQSLGARTLEGQNLSFVPDRTISIFFTLAF
jgi:tetratricopeptide (TPR) repeat protein